MREKLRALWLGQRDRLLTLTIAVALVFAIVHAWPRALPPSRHVDVAPSPGKMGAFVPNPTTNGPLYVNQGELTAGSGNFSNFLLGKEPVLASGPIDAGACTTMLLDPSRVACGETVADDALVEIKIVGDLNAPAFFTKLEFLGGGNCSTGALATADGGTVGTVIAAPVYPPLLIDASAAWSPVSDGGLALQVCSPGTATTYANVSLSAVHALPQFQGTSATQLDAGGHYVLSPYPNTVPVVIDGGANYTFVTTYGDMVGATGGSFSNGVSTFTCSTFTIINEHLATCVLATGIYDAGTGADASLTVAVAGASNSPAACPGCATATAGSSAPLVLAAAIPGVSSATGSQWVQTVVLTSGTCTGTTTATVGGVAATAVSCLSTSKVQFTPPANGSSTGSGATPLAVVVTSNGATGSTSTFWYLGSATAIIEDFEGSTLAGGVWTTWADSTGNGNTCTSVASPTTTTLNGRIAATFNGTSQYCQTATNTCTSGAVTLSATAVYATAGANQTVGQIAGSPTVSAPGTGLVFGSAVTDLTDGVTASVSFSPIVSGNTYFFGGVHAASSGTSTLYTGVSGSLSSSTTGSPLGAQTTGSITTIGALDTNVVSFFMNGAVGSFRARCGSDAADVATDYATDKARWAAQ